MSLTMDHERARKQAELLTTANRMIALYAELYPDYGEALRAATLLGGGIRLMGGHEQGRYVVRDQEGAEVVVVDLRSWRAVRE